MKIFGFEIRKAVENISKGRLRNGGSLSSYGNMPASSFDLFFKYYRKNIDMMGAVREIGQTVGKGGFLFKNAQGDVVENKKLQEVFKRNGGFNILKRSIIKHMSITGNVFLLVQVDGMGGLYGIQALDPRTIRIVVDEYGDVMKYIQQTGGQMQSRDPDLMMHGYDELDSDNEIFGQSLVEGIVTDVLADNEAMLSNYYWFKNASVPSQIIVLEEGMTDDQKKIVIDQMKADFSGGKNKHKMAVTNGVKDIKSIQQKLSEMEFEVLRKLTTQKICVAFSVPKTIMGYTDGVNYTNGDTQYVKFIENTIIPREEKIALWINDILGRFDEYKDVRFEFDSDHINDYDKRVEIAVKQVNNGLITVNEARQDLGREAYKDCVNADKPLMNKSYDLLDDAGLSDMPVNNGLT